MMIFAMHVYPNEKCKSVSQSHHPIVKAFSEMMDLLKIEYLIRDGFFFVGTQRIMTEA